MTESKNRRKCSQQSKSPKLEEQYSVTWDELTEIYARGLSLEKYDEIRLRKTIVDKSPFVKEIAVRDQQVDDIGWLVLQVERLGYQVQIRGTKAKLRKGDAS